MLRPKTDDESAAASGWSGINDPPYIQSRRGGAALHDITGRIGSGPVILVLQRATPQWRCK